MVENLPAADRRGRQPQKLLAEMGGTPADEGKGRMTVSGCAWCTEQVTHKEIQNEKTNNNNGSRACCGFGGAGGCACPVGGMSCAHREKTD